jgi:tetratricopeptide (TPR) repeat protein
MKRMGIWFFILLLTPAAWAGSNDDCQPIDVYVRSAKIYMGLGQAAQQIPDFASAQKQLQKALDCYPDAVEPRYLLAIIHWRKRAYDKFLVLARELDTLDTEHKHIDTVWQMRRAAWGELFNRGVDSLKASNQLDSVRAEAQASGDTAQFDSLTNQGRRYLESAKRLFQFALDMDSSRSEPYQNLGVIDVRLQNWDEALVWYRRSLEAKPGDPDLIRNLMSLNMRLNRLDSAMHYSRLLLDTNPDDLEALTNKAGLYARMGFPDSANLVFEEIISKDPNNKPVLFNLGMTKVQSAQEYMEEKKRFVQQANDYAQSYNKLVAANAAKAKLDAAHQQQQDALSSLKDATTHAEESWTQASSLYERLASLDSTDYEAFYYWGLSQFWLENYEAAVGPLSRCVELNPDYCPAWQILSYAYVKLGKSDQAVEARQKFESCGK